MGTMYETGERLLTGRSFRAIELSGDLHIDKVGAVPFVQTILLSNDSDTLYFAERNMLQMVLVAKKVGIMNYTGRTALPGDQRTAAG